MKFVLFYHSLVSDWNHGNAHFLRGLVRELKGLGHAVTVYEPADGWSRRNLLDAHGSATLEQFAEAFPDLRSVLYDLRRLDLDRALDGADVVLVHEWNDPALVERLGRLRSQGAGFRLLFHDTHHRSVSQADAIAAFDLSGYDGVLAFGEVIRERYLRQGWAQQAWTWHEAADTALFYPRDHDGSPRDAVWVGNWGDGERTAELREYLLEPVKSLALQATVHGVRYPESALKMLDSCGIAFSGWLANYRVPDVFACHRFTLHIPRRPYATTLPGIPTIRVFEALACGVPLISAYWQDSEELFREGDFLLARSGAQMRSHMRALLHDSDLREELSRRGRETIARSHTCRHRAEELLAICQQLKAGAKTAKPRRERKVA